MEFVMVWVWNFPKRFMCLNPSSSAGGTVWEGYEGVKGHYLDWGIGSLAASIEDLLLSTVSCPISLLPVPLRCEEEAASERYLTLPFSSQWTASHRLSSKINLSSIIHFLTDVCSWGWERWLIQGFARVGAWRRHDPPGDEWLETLTQLHLILVFIPLEMCLSVFVNLAWAGVIWEERSPIEKMIPSDEPAVESLRQFFDSWLTGMGSPHSKLCCPWASGPGVYQKANLASHGRWYLSHSEHIVEAGVT